MTPNDYSDGWVRVFRDDHDPDPSNPFAWNILADIHPPEPDDPRGLFFLTWRQGKDNDFTRAEIERLWQALGFVQGKATT